MKAKYYSLIIALSLFSFTSKGQDSYLLDSVQINLGNHQILEVLTEDFYKTNRWGNLDSLYDLFIGDLEKVEGALIKKNASNNMKYQYRSSYRRIQMNSESTVAAEVYVDSNGQIIYFQTVEFELGSKDKLRVKAPTIEGLKKIAEYDLNAVMKQAEEKLSPNGKRRKKHKSASLVYENGQFSDETSNIETGGRDLIELGTSLGVGVIRSNITPDLDISLLVGLSKKGRIKHQLGLSNQWMYSFPIDAEGNYQPRADGFLDLVYMNTTLKDAKGFRTTGMKFGALLTNDDESNFRNNAYRFGLFNSLGHGVSLEGGFIWEDDWRISYPYARLAWSW